MTWFHFEQFFPWRKRQEPTISSRFDQDTCNKAFMDRLQNAETAISNMSSKLSSNTQYLAAQMQKLLELEGRIDKELKLLERHISDEHEYTLQLTKRLEIQEVDIANSASNLEKAEYINEERHIFCVQHVNGIRESVNKAFDSIKEDRRVINQLNERIGKVDKLINKVARDIKKGDKKKATKDVGVLKAADKVQDKKLAKLEKKAPKSKKKVKK
jgi:DNA repair exonuclease SbcCD ATPase subunit